MKLSRIVPIGIISIFFIAAIQFDQGSVPKSNEMDLTVWSRNRSYRICIRASDLKGSDEYVRVTIVNGRDVEVLTGQVKLLLNNTQSIGMTHRKAKFKPRIRIEFMDGNLQATPAKSVSTVAESACGPGQGQGSKDKLSSTSSQGSTVLVTIDE